jgi:hypothetical protein
MLLENERLLLVLADRDTLSIYLESLTGMDAALQGPRAIQTFYRNKMGEDVLFAYDEVKRMLVACAAKEVRPMYLVNVGLLAYCATR